MSRGFGMDEIVIANTFIQKGIEESVGISPMKLQKLIYLLYARYLKNTGEQMFSNRFEAWEYGPVLENIYQHFKKFGTKPITEFVESEPGESYMYDLDDDTDFSAAFEYVWEKYKDYTGMELSRMTHTEGGAWEKAALYKQNSFLDDNDISNEAWI